MSSRGFSSTGNKGHCLPFKAKEFIFNSWRMKFFFDSWWMKFVFNSRQRKFDFNLQRRKFFFNSRRINTRLATNLKLSLLLQLLIYFAPYFLLSAWIGRIFFVLTRNQAREVLLESYFDEGCVTMSRVGVVYAQIGTKKYDLLGLVWVTLLCSSCISYSKFVQSRLLSIITPLKQHVAEM